MCTAEKDYHHWSLRQFGAKIISNICKQHTTTTDNVQTYVIQLCCAVLQNEDSHLLSFCGALLVLCEIEPRVILPLLKLISNRIEPLLKSTVHSSDKIAACNVRAVILKYCVPVLQDMGNVSDNIEDYKEAYGSFGLAIMQAVVNARTSLSKSTIPLEIVPTER